MKIKKLYAGVAAVLLLTSTMVGAEEKYPASDFKPKVVYQDADYKPVQSKSTSSAKQQSASDPNYPASDFQPKVLYKDADYKPVKSSSLQRSASKLNNVASSSQTGSTQATNAQKDSDSDSDNSLVLVILVLAALFYFFNRKGTIATEAKESKSSFRNRGGLTGVSKYLQDKDKGTAVSGVAKYLEKQAQNSATGVAKYMAKQAVSVKESANSELSGVEKYLRDKS